MFLKFIAVDVDSDSESDYDTAVDIVHYSWSHETYLLELPSGVCLELKSSSTCRTSSYLEPDFDLLEETDELRYVQHPSGSPAERSESLALRVIEWSRGVVVTQAGWNAAVEQGEIDGLDVSESAFDWVGGFANGMFDPESSCTPCPVSAEALFSAIQELVLPRVDARVSVNALQALVGQEFAAWCKRTDAQGWHLANERWKNRLENRCELALARLSHWISKQ